MSSKNAKGENPGSNTRDVNAANRASMAFKLRLEKLSYEEIANRVGFANKGACHNAIQREMQRCLVKDVQTLRDEELAILDSLHSVCWTLAMDKANRSRLFAVDRLLAISEARRKLLNLDIPADTGINGNVTVIREVPNHYLGIEAQIEVPKSE